MTGPCDTVPLLHGPLEIGDGPELSIRGCSARSKELTRRVLVELRAHALSLGGGQFSPIATHASIDQPSETIAPVATTPVHETGSTAAGDLLHVWQSVASAIQANGLVARARRTIFGVQVRVPEFSGLHLVEDELSFSHTSYGTVFIRFVYKNTGHCVSMLAHRSQRTEHRPCYTPGHACTITAPRAAA